jgi:hypothetical protein
MRNPNDGKGSRTTPTDPIYAPQRFCNDFYLGASTLSIFLLRARGLSFGSNVCVVLWAVFALALIDPPNATNCFSLSASLPFAIKARYAHGQLGNRYFL